MTIIIDDAGSGDLLFGLVIGAYRPENGDFKYDVVDVKYFQRPLYEKKAYVEQIQKTIESLLRKLKPGSNEKIQLCRGTIFDRSAAALMEKYGETRISRTKVIGEAQHCTEIAYLDEIRNLGYEPIPEREEKRGKSFFHMLRWLSRNPERLRYAKTGWPRLTRYRLFREEDN